MKVLAIDPGEHIGWAFYDTETCLCAGQTLYVPKDQVFEGLKDLITSREPDLVIYETFSPYPGAAKVRNDQFTSQVIGMISAITGFLGIRCIGQQPSCKKFIKKADYAWMLDKIVRNSVERNAHPEHMHDAIKHLCHHGYKNKISLYNKIVGEML